MASGKWKCVIHNWSPLYQSLLEKRSKKPTLVLIESWIRFCRAQNCNKGDAADFADVGLRTFSVEMSMIRWIWLTKSFIVLTHCKIKFTFQTHQNAVYKLLRWRREDGYGWQEGSYLEGCGSDFVWLSVTVGLPGMIDLYFLINYCGEDEV